MCFFCIYVKLQLVTWLASSFQQIHFISQNENLYKFLFCSTIMRRDMFLIITLSLSSKTYQDPVTDILYYVLLRLGILKKYGFKEEETM